MKTLLMIAPLTFLYWSCEAKIGPVMKIEATLGTPFVVSAPAVVNFKEIGSTLHIVSFSNYITFGIAMGTTDATVIYADKTYEISNVPHCEPCPRREVDLGGNLRLVYDKIIKERCIKSYEGGRCEMKVDSAQFILKAGI